MASSASCQETAPPEEPRPPSHLLVSTDPPRSSSRSSASPPLNANGKRGHYAPGAASGGVPDPAPAYLAQAAVPPCRLAQPRRILVVLDLNGTLLFRPDPRRRSAARNRFVERPHACTFLAYCLATFAVAIWSSARPANIDAMLAQLLTPAQRAQLVVVWGRDRFGLTPHDYGRRVMCYKRLDRLWAAPEVQRARRQPGVWGPHDTILVDDSVEKARAHPYNLVCVPEFAGDGNGDLVIPQVHDYINELACQEDISRYVRASPFQVRDDYSISPAV